MNNAAFIDGQNLRRGTMESENPWKVDLIKFNDYLKWKYGVYVTYYFMGYYVPEYRDMYKAIEEYGYKLVFKESLPYSVSAKKGNVDTDIVFEIMRHLIEDKNMDKVVLVSGDGDYYKTIRYLLKNKRLEKILGPEEKFMSSLYTKKLEPKYYAFLNRVETRNKIKR